MGLDEEGHPVAGIPVLRDVLYLGTPSDNAPLDWQHLPDDPRDLLPVVEEHSTDTPGGVEIRHPVHASQGDASEPGLRDAESENVPVRKGSSGFAALWGLLRGFAGTRVHDGSDEA